MKFTIITVCYNAQNDIKRTIESVLEQTYAEFQYIVKDGQSTDNTLQIAKGMAEDDARVLIESGKDGGIYDAMNQAVQMAEGEYVFFLNAGDTFHASNVLEQISGQIEGENADVLYGDILFQKKDGSWVKKYRNIYRHKWIYLLGDCICHQAMFAKKELFEERKFDTNYKICADREWQLYYLKRRASFVSTQIIISDVLVDGFSMQNVEMFEKEAEACLEQYFAKLVWIYRTLKKCTRNSSVRWLMKKYGNR